MQADRRYPDDPASGKQEMVEDMLAIVHTFSCRPGGMQKYEKVLRADFSGVKTTNDPLD